jgi:hypothetical protein
MEVIAKGPAFGDGKLFHAYDLRTHNFGTTVVTMMKHKLDV